MVSGGLGLTGRFEGVSMSCGLFLCRICMIPNRVRYSLHEPSTVGRVCWAELGMTLFLGCWRMLFDL